MIFRPENAAGAQKSGSWAPIRSGQTCRTPHKAEQIPSLSLAHLAAVCLGSPRYLTNQQMIFGRRVDAIGYLTRP